MKKLINLVSLSLLMTVSGAVAQEQTKTSEAALEVQAPSYFDELRAEFRKNKAAIVGLNMNLSADELVTFWRVYAEYEKELTTLNTKRIKLLDQYLENFDKMTAKNASSIASQYFANQRARLNVREKYSKKLAILLSPVAALRFVQVESQIGLIVETELARRLPLVQKDQDSMVQ